jgi:hypothetical protein
MPKRKIKWNFGDVFIVPLLNNKYAVGQVLDLMMANIVRCAFYDELVDNISNIDISKVCDSNKLISLVATSREQLDYDVWKIIGNKEVLIPKSRFPNEECRSKGWVGAIIHDAALAEDFLNAFYALAPWDDWYNPNYLDEFLVDISKKPKNLIYVKTLQ